MTSFDCIVPTTQDIEALAGCKPLGPFAPETVSFVSALSKAIMTTPKFRAFPEMMAFAYWMRTARLKQLQKQFEQKADTGLLMPRGLAFHISPSNVDTIFLYSFLLSMLVGNKNIVRLSSRESEQVGAILELFNHLFEDEEHWAVRDRLVIVRYGHDDEVTRYFSSLCDLRVIWGGDVTINTIRALPLPPRATEISFADKVSLAVFDATEYGQLKDKSKFIHDFINDSFWFGQMACSSPRLVIWRGDKQAIKQASKDFWQRIEVGLVDSPPELSEMDFLNKLVFEQSVAMARKTQIRDSNNNNMNIVQVADLDKLPIEDHCGGGLFLEAPIKDITELTILLSKRYQTIVSFGIEAEEWNDFITRQRPEGVDRIVRVGEALTFSPVWDGFDLLREFSREISVQV